MVDLAQTLKQKEEALRQKEKELEQLRAELEILREAQRICLTNLGLPAEVKPQPPGPEPVPAAARSQIAGRRFP